MKKIYVLFLFGTVFSGLNAQISLTKANNEPVIGDVFPKQSYDSLGAVPKNTGANQIWNFSTMTVNSATETSVYMAVSATPNPTMYPAATIAEQVGNNNYTYYKSTSTTFEVQGFSNPGFDMNFSNSVVFANWPITFGSSNTDSGGGIGSAGVATVAINGTANVAAPGSGTVILPGNVTLNNVLQVITTITITQSSGTTTVNQLQKQYDYYHGSQKFPVMTMQYQSQTSGTVTSLNFSAWVNKNVVAGIADHSFISGLSVYPNPAKDQLIILMNNVSGEVATATITDLSGRELKAVSLGNSLNINGTIDVSDLGKGVYLLTLKSDKNTVTRRIIVE
jgi:hypothetical protein